MEFGGIECHNIVLRLHDDSTILQFHAEPVVKGAIRDIVIIVIAHYLGHYTFADDQCTNTVTGTHPNIMIVIFHDGVYYIVIQSVVVSIYYGLRIIRHI